MLIGWRADRVVASGSYDRLREPAVAEVAFTVAEDFKGRGVATRMLEQLAEIGAERGIARFDAEVMDSNQAMLAVFKRAGFGVRSRLDFDELLVSLDIQPTEAVQEKIEERDHLGVVASLRSILAPASVAVVGASNEPGSRGGDLFANLIAGGFRGAVVPVNRSGGVVRSVRAARSLGTWRSLRSWWSWRCRTRRCSTWPPRRHASGLRPCSWCRGWRTAQARTPGGSGSCSRSCGQRACAWSGRARWAC